MKKNYKKIIVGIILSIIGIGTIIYLDKTSTPELEVIIEESVLEAESTEAIPPEEEIEEVEVAEEKPQGKKLNAYDAQKFLASQNEPTSVATNKYWKEKPVAEEVIEPETVENVVINEEPVASTEIVQANVDETGHYDASGDISNFTSYPMNKVDNLNDIAWKCIAATLEEVYPSKGAILSSEVKKACESGSPIYSNLDTWVEFSDMHTKVIYDTNDGNLLFIFR